MHFFTTAIFAATFLALAANANPIIVELGALVAHRADGQPARFDGQVSASALLGSCPVKGPLDEQTPPLGRRADISTPLVDIPSLVKALVGPYDLDGLLEALTPLTTSDYGVLREILASHAQYETEEQALEALKAKSESLYNKVVELRMLVKNRIDALRPEEKASLDNLIEQVKQML